jgi:hypothetical protein
MGFGPEYVELFGPYLAPSKNETLIGSSARAVLASTPLSISLEQAQEINRLVFSWHANSIGSQFNREFRKHEHLRGIFFSSLPSRFQTAMANLSIVDRNFVQSEAFQKLATGQWSAGLSALAEYPSTNPAIIARARAAATGLTELEMRMLLPQQFLNPSV